MKNTRKTECLLLSSLVNQKLTFLIKGKEVQRILRKDIQGFYIKYENQRVKVQLSLNYSNKISHIESTAFCQIDHAEIQKYCSLFSKNKEEKCSINFFVKDNRKNERYLINNSVYGNLQSINIERITNVLELENAAVKLRAPPTHIGLAL